MSHRRPSLPDQSTEILARIAALEASDKAKDAEIAALEAWRERQLVVNFGHDTRIRDLEGPDAKPQLTGYTVAAFAKRVCRSKELVRKLVREKRIDFVMVGVHPTIAADATLPPRRKRKSTI